jgi:hypothetical protein
MHIKKYEFKNSKLKKKKEKKMRPHVAGLLSPKWPAFIIS